MADDYSLDPFQVEEDILKSQYTKALAKTLRPKWDANDPFSSGAALSNYYQSDRKLGELDKQKAELAQRVEKQMIETLRGAPQELQDMVRNPGTRAEGAKALARYREQEMQYNKLNEMRNLYGPGIAGSQTIGAGDTGDNPYGLAKAASENPYTASIGKQMMDNQTGDPTKVRLDRSGNASVIPGATAALTQIEDAKMRGRDDLVDYKMPDGQIVKQPRSWVENEMRKYQTGAAPGAPPSSSLPPPSGGPPATALPGAVGAAASAPNRPVSAPPGPSSAPPGGEVAAFGQPQTQTTRMDMLQAEVKRNFEARERARAAGDQQGITIATRNLQQLDQEMKLVQKQNGPSGGQVPSGMAAGQQPPPQQPSALPGATAAAAGGMPPARIVPPTGPAGVGPTPFAGKMSDEQLAVQKDAMKKFNESVELVPSMLQQLDQLENILKKPVYSGGKAEAAKGINWAANTIQRGNAGVEDPVLSNTRAYEGLIKEMSGPRARLLGYNPSNFDLNTALAQLPNMGDSPGSRAAVIGQLRKGMEYHMQSIPVIQELTAKGVTVSEAQKYFHEAVWPKIQEQKRQQPNPTEAPGAQSALPGATSAAGAAALPRGMPPPAPPPAEGPNVSDFLTSKEGWRAMGESAASLPGAIAAQGGPAMKDTVSNFGRGVAQLFGQSDRAEWPAEKARQDALAAKNPQYAQARHATDIIGNPTNYIPGATIPKMAAAGVVGGITQPGASFTEQVQNAASQGGLAAVTGAASRAVPSTKSVAADVGPEVTKLLREYPSVKATSPQLNPNIFGSTIAQGLGLDTAAALKQQKGLTLELMKRAGIEGKTLTPDAITKAREKMSTEYEGLFKSNIYPKIPTNSAQILRTAMGNSPELQPIMAGSKPLATVYAAIMTGNPVKLSAATLHQAWKDIGQVATDNPASAQAAGQARKILEDIVANAMPGKDRGIFRDLNRRWGATEDIDRVFTRGGGGTGAAYGTLNPAKLKTEQGRGPNTGGVTDQSVQLIDALGMRNAVPNKEVPASVQSGVQRLAGPALNALDWNAVNAPAGVRKFLDLLRAGTAKGSVPAIEEIINAP